MQTRSSKVGTKRSCPTETSGEAKSRRQAEQSPTTDEPNLSGNRPLTRSQRRAVEPFLELASNSSSLLLCDFDDDTSVSDCTEECEEMSEEDSNHATPTCGCDIGNRCMTRVATDPRLSADTFGATRKDCDLASHQPSSTEQKLTPRQPSPDYMERQPDIDAPMRGILVDWLVEVAEEFHYKSESLFQAVAIIDNYLDHTHVKKDHLQLVGVSAMLIAAKEQEEEVPQYESFVYISDNTYTRAQIEDMERLITQSIPVHNIQPTLLDDLKRFQDSGDVDEEVVQLSNYLCELALLEYSFLKYQPSEIAAAAVSLALWTVECPPWSEFLEHVTGLKQTEFNVCLAHLWEVFSEAPNAHLQAVREKYSAPNPFLCVASIPARDTLPPLPGPQTLPSAMSAQSTTSIPINM